MLIVLTKIAKTYEQNDIHATPTLSESNPWKFVKLWFNTFDAVKFQTPEFIKKNTLYKENDQRSQLFT